jgi:hypothetical protein
LLIGTSWLIRRLTDGKGRVALRALTYIM